MHQLNDLTHIIIGSALRIHTGLGPGLFESVYETVLASDIRSKGIHVERQKIIPIKFEGRVFEEGFRADLLVGQTVLVEIKSIRKLAPVHAKQVLTYLRLLEYPVGLLLNFGEDSLRIKRLINSRRQYAHPVDDEDQQ